MLSSSLNTLLKLSKTTCPQNLFAYDAVDELMNYKDRSTVITPLVQSNRAVDVYFRPV